MINCERHGNVDVRNKSTMAAGRLSSFRYRTSRAESVKPEEKWVEDGALTVKKNNIECNFR